MNTKDELINFLVFSYFGEEYSKILENKNTLMIQKCCERAYLDLSRTIDYSISTSELNDKEKTSSEQKEEFERKKEEFKMNIYTSLYMKISCNDNECKFLSLKFISNQKEFDDWHNKVCIKIQKISQNSKELFSNNAMLTYGQAQKWLNMTLKYLLLLGYWEEDEALRLEKLFHVPVDSYIMEAASKYLGIGIPQAKTDKLRKYSDSSSKKWSNWEYPEYKTFQNNVRTQTKAKKNTYPFEWEGPAWIKISKSKR